MDRFYEAFTHLTAQPDVLSLLALCAVKGALILLVAGLLTLGLKGASAAVRHWIWSLALTSVLLLPILTFVVPAWQVAMLEAPASVPLLSEGVAPPPPAPVPTPAPAPPPPLLLPGDPEPALVPDGASTASAAAALPMPWDVLPPAALLMLTWLVGAFGVLAYFAVGTLRAGWWSRQASHVDDPAWTQLAEDVAWELYLKRPVTLVWSDRAATPMTWGIFRPRVLLPLSAQSWPEERRRVVLLHEMAHIQRWDCLTQALAQVTCALNWFNPFVWWGARQLRVEREHACDDQVLQRGTRASSYAEHLLEIARSLRKTPGQPFGAVAMAKRSQLEGRLLAILEPGLNRQSFSRAGSAFSTLLFACAIVPLAAMRPWGEPAPEAAPVVADVAAPPVLRAPTGAVLVAPSVPTTLGRDDVIERTFSVQPGGELTIRTDLGSIEVRTHDASTVVAEIEREGDDDDLADFEISFDQSGDDVTIRGEGERRRGWWGSNRMRIHFTVTVPAEYNVDLRTAGGSISVDDLTGDAELRTSGGSLSMGRINGTVDAETSGGSISMRGSAGDANVRTSGGSISLGEVLGTVRANTSGGSISVDEVQGDIEATTSGGSVTATITKQPEGDCILKTSGGSVRVYLADGIDLDVDARTSAGRVSSDFHDKAAYENDRRTALKAPIGEGGPELYLRTSAGNIRIERMTRGARTGERMGERTGVHVRTGHDDTAYGYHTDCDEGCEADMQAFEDEMEAHAEAMEAHAEAMEEAMEARAEAFEETMEAFEDEMEAFGEELDAEFSDAEIDQAIELALAEVDEQVAVALALAGEASADAARTAAEVTMHALEDVAVQLDSEELRTNLRSTLDRTLGAVLESLVFADPEDGNYSIDGCSEPICLLDAIDELPEEIRAPILESVAREHDDPDVRDEAARLLQ